MAQAYYLSLKQMVQKLALDEVVVFISQYMSFSELGDVLSSADVFVAPYTDEGTSSSGTVSMAMSAALPVIATPFLFTRHALQHGRGVLVDFVKDTSLVRAILVLSKDNVTRSQIGNSALKYAAERYFDNMGGAYLRLMRAE